VIPAAFEYHAPTSLQDALTLLQTLGSDAKVLAGGHSLLPMMKLRLATPAHVIDLRRVPGLREITATDGEVVIGALATHWAIQSSPLLQQRTPLLVEAAASIGDLQVRNMGTIGGSLAHADPAADYPAAVLALDAVLVAQGPRGRRTIPAGEFFTGLYTTALAPDELLVEVRVPVRPGGAAYLKFPHPASGFAVVGVAALLRLRNGTCEEARVGVTGVSPVPYRARKVEEALVGRTLDPDTLRAAAEHAADGVDVNEDVFASAEYRRHLAKVFARRSLARAVERAGAAR